MGIAGGHLTLVKLLVQHGGEALLLRKVQGLGTCLHLACTKGDIEIVKYLVEAGGEALLLQLTDGSGHRT